MSLYIKFLVNTEIKKRCNMLADPGREGIEAYDKDHNDYLHILAMLDTSVHHSISIYENHWTRLKHLQEP